MYEGRGHYMEKLLYLSLNFSVNNKQALKNKVLKSRQIITCSAVENHIYEYSTWKPSTDQVVRSNTIHFVLPHMSNRTS